MDLRTVQKAVYQNKVAINQDREYRVVDGVLERILER